MKRIFITLLLAFSLVACQNQQPYQSQSIGVVVYDDQDPFIQSITNQLMKLANQHNLNITLSSANQNQDKQDELVRDLISDGVSILCVNLVDRTETSNIIRYAQQANVPVIFFNREPVRSDLERWDKLFYVGANSEQAGRYQGQIVANYLASHPDVDRNQDHFIQTFVLEGEPGHQDAIIRTETALATLKNAGIHIDQLGHQLCQWDRKLAFQSIQQQLHLPIELILANNDEMAIGAAQAYEQAGLTLPAIVGIDGTKDGQAYVKQHKLIGTVLNDNKGQAKAIFHLIQDLLAGQENLPVYTLLDYQKILA